jgi:hypothetical protein
MSTRNLHGDEGQPECEANNLTAICEQNDASQPFLCDQPPATGLVLPFILVYVPEHVLRCDVPGKDSVNVARDLLQTIVRPMFEGAEGIH